MSKGFKVTILALLLIFIGIRWNPLMIPILLWYGLMGILALILSLFGF